jgi:NADH-quinone oxidoreductase subunit L
MYLSYSLLILGRITLLLARIAALMEVDGKKVVALSTLRQLGLIFIAISLGNNIICLFHLLIHAFAKANLFLIVGNFLHIRFSQQDSRQLSTGVERRVIFLIIFVSVLRLRGVVFSRGFFSKDSILLREFSLISRFLVWLILIRIITLTLTYCIKLFMSLVMMENSYTLKHTSCSSIALYPRVFLVVLRVYLGYVMFNNIEYLILFSKRTSGFYWSYLVVRVGLLLLRLMIIPSF